MKKTKLLLQILIATQQTLVKVMESQNILRKIVMNNQEALDKLSAIDTHLTKVEGEVTGLAADFQALKDQVATGNDQISAELENAINAVGDRIASIDTLIADKPLS